MTLFKVGQKAKLWPVKTAKLGKLLRHRLGIEREWNLQRRRLLALPKQFGYRSTDELIASLKFASTEAAAVEGPRTPSGRKRRVNITAKIEHAVQRLAENGASGQTIGIKLGISPASVQNIKKRLGLTKKYRVRTGLPRR